MSLQSRPIRTLTSQLRKHDAFRFKNLSKIAGFYAKLIAEKPFRLFETIKSRKLIENHQLADDPVFIIGHWRSGTSFLQYLMGSDPQFGYLNKFEALFPGIFLNSESLIKSWAEKLPHNSSLFKDAQNMSINLKWDSPSEVEIALSTMISPASPHWGHIFPHDGEEYFNKFLLFKGASKSEINRWQNDYHHLIKKISIKNDGRQVLVKSPANTSRLKALINYYPDARFIFIHRNPYDIFYSSQKLWNTLLDNLAFQEFSQFQMEQKIISIYKKMMSQYIEQRNLVPDRQLVEVRFDEFISDPLANLKNMYCHLGINNFEKAGKKMNIFLKNRITGDCCRYEYEDDIIDQLNSEWSFAFEEWNYKMTRQNEIVSVAV